jgi:NitT/TauT family transport system substrate-binding protein
MVVLRMRRLRALTTVFCMTRTQLRDFSQHVIHRRSALALLACSWATAGWPQTKLNKKIDTLLIKPEKKTLVIATANRYALVYLPLLVAEQLGYFTQMGLELEVNEQQSMARAQQTVLSGAADVVCGWVENTLAMQAKGQIFQSFVLMGRSPNVALGVSTKASQVSQLAQLKGRKIGVVALGSPTHTVAHALLRHAGVASADMSFVSVGSAASALAALRAGQIDALAHMDPLMTQLEQRAEIKILADARAPQAAQQTLGSQLPSSCLYAPADFFQLMPGAAQACCDAIVLALRWLDQASLLDIMRLLPAAAVGEDRQALIGSLQHLRQSFSPDGLMPPKVAQQLLEAMRAADSSLGAEMVDAERSYTNAMALHSSRL